MALTSLAFDSRTHNIGASTGLLCHVEHQVLAEVDLQQRGTEMLACGALS